MVPVKCISMCFGKAFAGVQNSKDCWCGDEAPTSSLTSDDECDMPCVGDSSQICGGASRMNVYSTGALFSGPPPSKAVSAIMSSEHNGKLMATEICIDGVVIGGQSSLCHNCHPILDTRISVRPSVRTCVRVSRSGDPPWILKRAGLESSGRIPSSLYYLPY